MGYDVPVMQRGSLTRFVDRHRLPWELGMTVLACIYVWLSLQHDQTTRNVPGDVLLAFSAVFVVEFTTRCWDSGSRWAYARRHWPDLLASIPFLGPLRAFQVLRIFRLAFGLRFLRTAEQTKHRGPEVRQSLWFLGPCLLLLWVGAAYAMWVFEHDTNPQIQGFGDALYWSFITATTVGYGDISPHTQGGRVVSGALVFLGIGLVGFASSRLTAYWLRTPERPDALTHEVRELRTELQGLRYMLEAHYADAGTVPTREPGPSPRTGTRV
jgi:voltage-gated potassium channel